MKIEELKKRGVEKNKIFKYLTSRIYGNQRRNARRRKHNLPNYSLNELRIWIKQQPNFEHYFKHWIKSDYKKQYVPSLNRKNNNLSYTLDNLELLIWETHYNKSMEDIRNGIIKHGNKPQRPVINHDLNGNKINEFVSIIEASRQTGADISRICLCCNDKAKSSGGYIWKYKNDIN